MTKFRYVVKYRRDNASLARVFRATVTASDAEEARAMTALYDPHYLSTVSTPRRTATVETESELRTAWGDR